MGDMRAISRIGGGQRTRRTGAPDPEASPWKACYSTVNFVGGTAEFVLSSQGHIQALVNPSGNPKGRYFTNADAITSAEPLDAAMRSAMLLSSSVSTGDPGHRGPADRHRPQSGGADREPYSVCHVIELCPAPAIRGRSSGVTQPGGRSLTAGTALSARSPVARQPAAAASRPDPSVNRNAGLLEDARGALDVDAVDVVLVARRPVRGRVVADPVHVLELDAGLAVVDAVDGEPHGGDVARRDDALGRLASRRASPTCPRWW